MWFYSYTHIVMYEELGGVDKAWRNRRWLKLTIKKRQKK